MAERPPGGVPDGRRGLHAARSLPHLSRIVELANASGALERPELAAARWHSMLTINGVDAASAAAPTTVDDELPDVTERGASDELTVLA